jgi:hypothetical protein
MYDWMYDHLQSDFACGSWKEKTLINFYESEKRAQKMSMAERAGYQPGRALTRYGNGLVSLFEWDEK